MPTYPRLPSPPVRAPQDDVFAWGQKVLTYVLDTRLLMDLTAEDLECADRVAQLVVAGFPQDPDAVQLRALDTLTSARHQLQRGAQARRDQLARDGSKVPTHPQPPQLPPGNITLREWLLDPHRALAGGAAGDGTIIDF